jgi:hypothetical protein
MQEEWSGRFAPAPSVPTKIKRKDRGTSESVQFYAYGNNYQLVSSQSRSAGAIFPVQMANLQKLTIDDRLFSANLWDRFGSLLAEIPDWHQ